MSYISHARGQPLELLASLLYSVTVPVARRILQKQIYSTATCRSRPHRLHQALPWQCRECYEHCRAVKANLLGI